MYIHIFVFPYFLIEIRLFLKNPPKTYINTTSLFMKWIFGIYTRRTIWERANLLTPYNWWRRVNITDCNWRVDIQKGVTHNFSKIVFLAKQILEVNANTIAQTIFCFQSEIFLFSIWKSKICISRCLNGKVSVPPCKISEMWVTPFWMSTLQLYSCKDSQTSKQLVAKILGISLLL